MNIWATCMQKRGSFISETASVIRSFWDDHRLPAQATRRSWMYTRLGIFGPGCVWVSCPWCYLGPGPTPSATFPMSHGAKCLLERWDLEGLVSEVAAAFDLNLADAGQSPREWNFQNRQPACDDLGFVGTRHTSHHHARYRSPVSGDYLPLDGTSHRTGCGQTFP